MKRALIIFVRNPELGKVKKRLAATVGDEKALEIYKQLLLYTRDISSSVLADKFVFYFNELTESDIWSGKFSKKIQCGNGLGDKMKNAFAWVFEKGYEQVIIIGSDCFELTTGVIDDAFKMLGEKNVVIGPANDGGYYLLGMKKYLSYIFEDKDWSTQHVYDQTINDLRINNISFHELVTLSDVDTEEDWLNSKKDQA